MLKVNQLNVKEEDQENTPKKKPKEALVAICHSMRTDSIPHWMHMATFVALAKPKYLDMYEGHIFDIGDSRSKMTKAALSIPEVTHLLFIDDDIVIPNRNALIDMMRWLDQNEQYIIGGLYSKKEKPHYPLIIIMDDKGPDNTFRFGFPHSEDNPPPKDSIIQVSVVPAGFLLVKREVFEKIGEPYFSYGHPDLVAKMNKSDLDAMPPGEDVYFSWKAANSGYRLFIDTRANCLHYCPQFVGDKGLIQEYVEGSKLIKNTEKVHKEMEELRKKGMFR